VFHALFKQGGLPEETVQLLGQLLCLVGGQFRQGSEQLRSLLLGDECAAKQVTKLGLRKSAGQQPDTSTVLACCSGVIVRRW
jgi:hypothetical protein